MVLVIMRGASHLPLGAEGKKTGDCGKEAMNERIGMD